MSHLRRSQELARLVQGIRVRVMQMGFRQIDAAKDERARGGVQSREEK